MLRTILSCVLAALLALPVAAQSNSAWREDVWLAGHDVNPCNFRHSRCDFHLRHIYGQLIEARRTGDDEALKEWAARLRLYHISNPDDRRVTD